MINSLKAYEILKTSELPQAQARIIAEAIGSVIDDNNLQQSKTLAVKEDVGRLEGKALNMEHSLRQDMLKLEGSLRVDIARLETKISEVKSELLRWMFVFWVGQVAATGAMVKLLK